MENFACKPGVIGLPVDGQRNCIRPGASRQSLAGQRIPHGFVEQARGVAAADDKVTNMEMIRVPARKMPDRVFALGRSRISCTRDPGERLQQRQRAQLQGVEL